METTLRGHLKKPARRTHGAIPGLGMLDPNENHEPLPEMLLVHDIANALSQSHGLMPVLAIYK